MKYMNKICTFTGLVVTLATTSLYASFDNSNFGGQVSGWRILADDSNNSQYFYDASSPRSGVNLPGDPNLATPRSITALVPEPTTMIAGALLLLPFGVSALRIMRQNKIK